MNQTFIQNVIDVHGNTGKEWLARIPQLIQKYEQQWQITVSKPFNLSYNYVSPAERSDGTPVVIKLGFPGDKEFISECAGLFHFNGEGSIRLLEEDINNYAMLLERANPGDPLTEIEDEEKSTRIAANLLKKLHRKAPKDDRLIHFKDWLGGYTRYKNKYSIASGPIPEKLFLLSEAINKKHFEDGPEEEYLIHGDFHHQNILSADRNEYLTIDTKGVIGSPAYDVATFLSNPKSIIKTEDIQQLIEKRIRIFSEELHLDRQKIIDWGIFHAVLSTIWTLENHKKIEENMINFAQMLLEIK